MAEAKASTAERSCLPLPMPALTGSGDGKGTPVLQTIGDPVKRPPVRHVRRPAPLLSGRAAALFGRCSSEPSSLAQESLQSFPGTRTMASA